MKLEYGYVMLSIVLYRRGTSPLTFKEEHRLGGGWESYGLESPGLDSRQVQEAFPSFSCPELLWSPTTLLDSSLGTFPNDKCLGQEGYLFL
jgi:hypothetical protein